MLIQFRFQNFKSFRDDTILDFSATKAKELPNHVTVVGKEKLLPVAAIFGANASGKSNIIAALRFMADYVVHSFGYGGDSKKTETLHQSPFLFDNSSKNAESSFEVYFIMEEDGKTYTYNYGFTLNQDGVAEEWLNAKAKTASEAKTIFYREGGNLDLPGLPVKSRENIRVSLEKEALIVSLGAKLKIDKLKTIRDWFYYMDFADFGDPVENIFLSTSLPNGFDKDEHIQAKVVSYLSTFDPSIIGFEVEPVKDSDKLPRRFSVDAVHRTSEGGKVTIPLQQESNGTLKMFALYPYLQNALQNGSVLVVDELNSRLHPLLVRNFMLTFLNPEINKNHAQLIFTTHDAWQLSNHLLRRDEIWFTEKDANGASTLYSLADFTDEDMAKICGDENYEKNYLLGKYGAIPSLSSLDMFKE